MARHSLQWRLTVALFLVALVAVVAVAILAAGATTRQFASYVERGPMMMMGRRAILDATRSYIEDGGWGGADSTARQLAQDYGARVVIQDVRGRVLADSDPQGPPLAVRGRLVAPGEGPVGFLLMGPSRPGAEERLFLQTTYRWLVVGALFAGALALGAGYLVTRRLTAPLESLTAASRRMAAGDHAARVDVSGHDEVGALAEAFNEMAASVERGEALRRRLIGDVAHELRTPLATLRSRVEALRDGVLPVDEATLASVADDVLVLSALVADLQELSLAESGALAYERVPFDLAEVVAEEAERFRLALESKEVALDISCTPVVGLVGDPKRIGQVVRNLVDNAAKHTDAGRVTVSCGTTGALAFFEVSDTGSGIPSEELPMVFERFYRTDTSRWRRRGGTGIGLTIARRIVADHGGRVEVRSQVSFGTTMRVELPVEPGRRGRAQGAQGAEGAGGAGGGGNEGPEGPEGSRGLA